MKNQVTTSSKNNELFEMKYKFYANDHEYLDYHIPVCGKSNRTTANYICDSGDINKRFDGSSFYYKPFYMDKLIKLNPFIHEDDRVVELDDKMFNEYFEAIFKEIISNMGHTQVGMNQLLNLCSLFAQYQLDKGLTHFNVNKYSCVFADMFWFRMYMDVDMEDKRELNLYIAGHLDWYSKDRFGVEFNGSMYNIFKLNEKQIECLYCILNKQLSTSWQITN